MKFNSIFLNAVFLFLAATAQAHNYGTCDASWNICAVSGVMSPGALTNYISTIQLKDGRRLDMPTGFNDGNNFFLAIVPGTQQVVAVSKNGWNWAPQFTQRIPVGQITEPVGDDADSAFARELKLAENVSMNVKDAAGFHSYCNDTLAVSGAYIDVYSTLVHNLTFATSDKNQTIATFVSEQNTAKVGYERQIQTADNKCPGGKHDLGPINYWGGSK